MWTWGVAGIASAEPDEWHYDVIFSANSTAEVDLVWNLNQTILFTKSSSMINESFNVNLPRTDSSWRWDWLIKNVGGSVLGVANFTVTHYPIRHPQRSIGSVLLGAGLAIIIAAPISAIWFKRQGNRPR